MSTQSNTMLVADVMMSLDRFPVIGETVIFKEALEEMSRANIGIACIINVQSKLLGVLTDGDIRRKLLRVQKPFSAFFIDDALDHAVSSPVTTRPDSTLRNAILVMEDKQIWDLPVVDSDGILVGLLHLHPAIQALLEIEE